MSPGESLLLLGCLCTLTVWWFLWAINHSCTPEPEPCEQFWPDEEDAVLLKWCHIHEDYSETEYVDLRKWDDELADIDADGDN